MFRHYPILFLVVAASWLFTTAAHAASSEGFELLYQVEISPETGMAEVAIQLQGKRLPKQLVVHFRGERYSDIESQDPIQVDGEKVRWTPRGNRARLSYRFAIDHQRSSGGYDSRITDDWTILRSDRLIPPISATMEPGLSARASLQLALPDEWTSALPYEKLDDNVYRIKDPERRIKRPKGWMIAGRIGSRQDMIAGTNTKVSAPLGENIHRQDTLAFLNWNLPYIRQVFPDFPDHLLVVTAADPMWRGGLSGTRSLFMHSERPLISGNRTSSMIHELIHVATGIRGDRESDWIVEGLAEFYSLEILRRSGGISQLRYDEAMARLAEWGQQAPSLLVPSSSGAVTARAATLIYALDKEIRAVSHGAASIDDVARKLAETRGEVSLAGFRQLAEQVAGGPLKTLDRDRLGGEGKNTDR
ncbi:hypothetical protein [Microbulbifer sp. TYP-18]|uniref:hypothetical protein n=1 Tax=Microbulbifer sp. TYP-18 TaxID=3230024 RepID=UPI0034C5E1F9